EGKLRDTETLLRFSKLPGKDVLLSQVLGTLMSPSYGLIRVLSGNMQRLIYLLNAKIKSEVIINV
ncbi:MAG: 50S ribosomal protein L10, partial [Patescibacteria group bacterium]